MSADRPNPPPGWPRPKRIQRKRTKGYRLPTGAIYVGRPGKWGNTYIPGQGYRDPVDGFHGIVTDATHAVALYRKEWEHWLTTDTLGGGRDPHHAFDALRGRNLACWCRLCPAHADGKPLGVECHDCAPCHADVLLEICALGERDAGKN